jgi:hypothetical protein
MKLEETMSKWFEETGIELSKCGLQNGFDKLVFAALPLLENYFDSALMILNEGRRLPAMALLRCTGEFIAKIIYCLQGDNSQGLSIDERTESWEKSTFKERKRYYENIIERYTGSDCKKVQSWIDKTDREIAKIKTDNKLPPTAKIFEEALGVNHPVGRAGMYQQYLGAVHLDLEILAKTTEEDGNATEFKGDVEYDIERLKFECLTQLFYFLQAVYNYYKLKNFDNVKDEYKTLIPVS